MFSHSYWVVRIRPTAYMPGLVFENELYDMTSSVLPELVEFFNASYVFDEFAFSSWRTDLVFVQVDFSVVYERVEKFGHLTPILKKNRQRVYNWFCENGPVTKDKFMDDGPYAQSYKWSLVKWLLNRGYLESEEKEGSLPDEWPISAQGDVLYDAVDIPYHSTIYAVELKQRNWEYAIEQANRAYRYADYWYVCLDAGGVPGETERVREELDEQGVGFLTADRGGVDDVSWTGEPSHCLDGDYECLYRGDFGELGRTERWRLNEESLEAIRDSFMERDAGTVHPLVVDVELDGGE